MKGYPIRAAAEALLRESEKLNPGPWGDHSRYVAKSAQRVAEACGMDGEKAYVLGLLHDIGRRFGYRHLGHVYDGWRFMLDLGYPDAARVCLTHSFCGGTLGDYIGNFDISPAQQAELEAALSAVQTDEYDELIQFCDAIAGAEGVVGLEKRMTDVKTRYGHYPQAKWDKNFALKAWFSQKCGRDAEAVAAGKDER